MNMGPLNRCPRMLLERREESVNGLKKNFINTVMISECVSPSFLRKRKYDCKNIVLSLFYTYPVLHKQPITTFLYVCLFLCMFTNVIL